MESVIVTLFGPVIQAAALVLAAWLGQRRATMLYVFGCALALLTAGTVGGAVAVMWRTGKGWDDWNSLRVVVVTFGLGLVAFLVVAGYSANQMAGVAGLVGAAIGYVFGKEPARPEPPGRPPPPA